jgi:DNA primase
MISQAKISEIRDRASIVEVISDYVTLKRAGRNYMGLCPFHGEKTPSFTVSEEKGIFHCFGCHTGGSLFHFLMKYDHLSFPEAVERVAKRYGITIERTGATGRPDDAREKESLYSINEKAAVNYHRILFSEPTGKKAREYLQSRGVDETVARRFMLGFAPQAGSALLDLIKREKIPLKDALRLGLIGQRGAQHFHEKFFARLIFPIANAGGKVVGFGGRVLDHGLPKYLNSSETPLFRKGSTLYGLYQAKEGIRKADRVVVVEGYLDVIALHQFGISHAVATLGTALTPDHVRLLARYTKNVIALFDGDEAGRKAAARSFEIFIAAGLLGRAAFLPAGEDPDTFIHREGREAVESILDQAVSLADYFFSWQEQQYGRSLEGKSRIANEVSRLLAKVSNPFEVDLLVRRAVDMLGIREELLRRPPTAERKLGARISAPAPSQPEAQTREDAAERSLISLMLRFPSVIGDVAKHGEVRQWLGARWQPLVDLVVAEWQERGKVDAFRLTQKLSPDEAPQVTALALEGEKIAETEYERMAADCLTHLRRRHLRGLERNLRIAIRAAEEQKDDKAKRERILEWQDIVRKERQLEHRRPEPKNTIR